MSDSQPERRPLSGSPLHEESVTQWIHALRQRDDAAAARQLWNRYFQSLVIHMRGRISNNFRRTSDEEDVALSAIDTLFKGIRADRFPDLEDRDSLWSLLLTLADRRATRHFRRETSQKRGGGKVRNLAEVDDALPRGSPSIEQLADIGPSPEYAAMLTDELEFQLKQLDNPLLRDMALLELEGYSPKEIQERLQLGSERSYFRKKKLLQTLWREMGDLAGE